MSELEGFAERFTYWRDYHGLTNYQISKDTGIPQATLSRWALGQFQPSAANLQRMSEVYTPEVTGWLLWGDAQLEEAAFGKKVNK